MEHRESVAGLERLADAFVTLLPDTPGLMVDRATEAPSNAIGWSRARNFRVRLRGQPEVGQASAYYRVEAAGLELMMASSRSDESAATPISEEGVPDREWASVRVSAGDEPRSAERILQRLRAPFQRSAHAFVDSRAAP